jgi:hypothetical protein
MTPASTLAIQVNRARVLALWAAVVAERLGFDWSEALTLGRAVAGLNAYSKGVHLGLFQPTPEAERERRKAARHGEQLQIDLLHRAVPAVQTPDCVRALSKEQPADPAAVRRYLTKAFGDRLAEVRAAMQAATALLAPEELNRVGFRIYEGFRPEVAPGAEGRGAKGELQVERICAAAAAVAGRPTL